MRTFLFTYCLLVLGLTFSQPITAQVKQETEKDSLVDPNAKNSFQNSFFKALSQRGIENYDKAIEILIDLKEKYDQEPVVFFQLGLNYFDLENYNTALKYFEAANVLKSNDYDIKEAIFRVYDQQKNYAKAIEFAESLASKNAEYFDVLANLYLITKQYQKALESLEKAEQVLGYDFHKDKLREVIFEAYNKPKMAVNYYKKRIELEPYNPLNHYRLINFLIEDKDYKRAITATQNALKQYPEYTRFYVLQVQTYALLDEAALALEALEKVVTDKFLEEKFKVQAINSFKTYVEAHPEVESDFINILNIASQTAEDNSSFLDLGLYYFETDKTRSLENFQKAAAQNPQDFQILKYICVLHFQLNQYEEAISAADQALEIFPTQTIFMQVKGESLIMQTQYNEAKSVLLDALAYVFEENESMQKIYESLGRAHEGLNEEEKANEYFKKANAIQQKLN